MFGKSSVQSSRGYSLIELMLVLVLGTVIVAALFSVVTQLQYLAQDLSALGEMSMNLMFSPVLLSSWLSHSGCNQWKTGAEGISVQLDSMNSTSDVDGPSAFPDMAFEDSFEQIGLRCREPHIQLRSGRGTFQPILRCFKSFSSQRTSLSSLEVQLEGKTLDRLRSGSFGEKTLQQKLFLWNFESNLFRENRE